MSRIDRHPTGLSDHLQGLRARSSARLGEEAHDIDAATQLLKVAAQHSGNPDLVMQIAGAITEIMPKPIPISPEARASLALLGIVPPQARLAAPAENGFSKSPHKDTRRSKEDNYIVLDQDELRETAELWKDVDGTRRISLADIAKAFEGPIPDTKKRVLAVKGILVSWQKDNPGEGSAIKQGKAWMYDQDTVDKFFAYLQTKQLKSKYHLAVKKNLT